jgi:hypothetical protein
MLHVIITCDYELPAEGRGNVSREMTIPTSQLLEVCDLYSAKLTIFAELAELWAFEDVTNSGYAIHTGFEAGPAIREQLKEVVSRGHDVQLHLHPHWLGARWNSGKWDLRYEHYRLTSLPDDEMVSVLQRGKWDLESLLKPVRLDYACVGYRAGNWNTQPSKRYVPALLRAGLSSDSSVFKGGYASSCAADFDYRHAYSNAAAWYASPKDINVPTDHGGLLEIPIASELAPLSRMLTARRCQLALRYLWEDHQVRVAVRNSSPVLRSACACSRSAILSRRFARKFDYCKLTGRELLSMTKRLARDYLHEARDEPVPLVMIGHSKEFTRSRDLAYLLAGLADQELIRFSTYREFVELYKATRNAVGRAGRIN